MPKIKYEASKLRPDTRAIIDQANVIIQEYAAAGYTLSLRQLYYQFVSRDLFPQSWADPNTGSTNNERSYKRLGDAVASGRMVGLIDWEAIIDRGRELNANAHWSDPANIVSACASQFRLDRWARQPVYLEVWVEKQALEGVLANVCPQLDVPYFSCKGYGSVSALWDAGHNRFRPRRQAGKKCVVLYLGDHDPSGIDMTRDVRERLATFARGDVEVVRLALNMDQVEEYQPPPNPSKATDSRYQGYVDEYGEECWELDALDPATLAALVEAAVVERRDEELWDEAAAEEQGHRGNLRVVAEHWQAAVDAASELQEGDADADDETAEEGDGT